MAVTISADLFGTNTPPLVQVVVQGLTGTEAVTVWAEPSNSPRRIVRGGYDLDPTSDALVLIDPMPELDRPIIYVVEWTLTGVRSQLSSAPVTVPAPSSTGHVLSDPYSGAAVLVDVVADPDERVSASRGSVLYPSGSAFGVALTDVRAADAGELLVYADPATVPGLVELLAPGTPIVSRHPADGCDQPPLEVLHVGDVKRRRRSRAGDRVFSLPYQVVAQPDPRRALSVVSLADLAAWYAPTGGTLATLATDHPTLLSIALDEWGVA